MNEEAYLVTPGKQPPVLVKVAGAVISHAPDPISMFLHKNWEWAQDRFREYGWRCVKVEEPLGL